MSRLLISEADRVALWQRVAWHQKRLGNLPEARHARWVAANIRNKTTPTKRPEEMRL